MAKQGKNVRSKGGQRVVWHHPWDRKQYLLIGAGIGVIVIGFLLLSTGIGSSWDNPLAVSVAPVVLVIGYCVIIPLAILFGGKAKDE
jgi:hypothetical protein